MGLAGPRPRHADLLGGFVWSGQSSAGISGWITRSGLTVLRGDQAALGEIRG
jgi:hypothetical protein